MGYFLFLLELAAILDLWRFWDFLWWEGGGDLLWKRSPSRWLTVRGRILMVLLTPSSSFRGSL